METLLNYLFGYDLSSNQVGNQVLPSTAASLAEDIVHVAHLGCLMLGFGMPPFAIHFTVVDDIAKMYFKMSLSLGEKCRCQL